MSLLFTTLRQKGGQGVSDKRYRRNIRKWGKREEGNKKKGTKRKNN